MCRCAPMRHLKCKASQHLAISIATLSRLLELRRLYPGTKGGWALLGSTYSTPTLSAGVVGELGRYLPHINPDEKDMAKN